MNSLELYIRARYPLIYIVGPEESSIMGDIEEISERLRKKVYYWSLTEGMTPYNKIRKSSLCTKYKEDDICKALAEVEKNKEPAIYVFTDIHHHIESPMVLRILKDYAQQLKFSRKTILFVSSELKIPQEIEKEILVYDYPYPNREELQEYYKSMLREGMEKKCHCCKEDDFYERLSDAALGLTYNEFENVLSKMVVQNQEIGQDQLKEIFAEKRQIIRKSGTLEFYDTTIRMEDIGGLDQLKEWLKRRKKGFKREAIEFGLPKPKGLLLLGVQGCGKSLAVKAISNYLEQPLLKLDMGRLFSSFMGSSEANIRKAIHQAESIAPVILWIDEIDKALSGMKSSGISDGGTTSRVIGTLLTWLQEKTKPVFVVATANNIESLPAEIFRKGRFDEIFFVDLPKENEREDIFAIHIEKLKRNKENYPLAVFAEKSAGFSGAEIEQAVINGLFEAFYEGKELEESHIISAIEEIIPLSKMMKTQLEKIRQWAKVRTKFAS